MINSRIADGYVRTWGKFHFLPGVLDALPTLAAWAPRIVVVTNQQGVGKGLMTAADLSDIHVRMLAAVTAAGGRIDAVEVCPHLAGDDCTCRKPNAGMPLRYLESHPEIDASLSMMVGDTASDVEMGRRLGTETGGCAVIRIDRRSDPAADATFRSLAELAREVGATLDSQSPSSHSAE